MSIVTPEDHPLAEAVGKSLRSVHDPEIPVNIFDLGLIYEARIDECDAVHVTMTLTTPNCPMAEIIPGQVEQAIAAVEGVSAATVELTWDPVWDPQMMTEAAKLELDFTGKFDPKKLAKKPIGLSINRRESPRH
jgi:FeS assembly SUF system protein